MNIFSKIRMNLRKSPLDKIIPPEVTTDPFARWIEFLSGLPDVQTIIEIGSSSGNGSTQSILRGCNARDNQNKPHVFCLEISKQRFHRLEQNTAAYPFVHCYNLPSVSSDEFPSEGDVIDFYKSIPTRLNDAPLNKVLEWLRDDVEYTRGCGADVNGLHAIKRRWNIENFDISIIDGSEFTGAAELDILFGSKFILLDDTETYKNRYSHEKLLGSNEYKILHHDPKLRNGFSIFIRTEIAPNYDWERLAAKYSQGERA